MLSQNQELLSIIRQQVVSGLQMVLEGPVRKALGSIVTQLVSSQGHLSRTLQFRGIISDAQVCGQN